MALAEMILIFLLGSLGLALSDSYDLDVERIAEFEHQLDMSGLDVINKMYEQHDRKRRDVDIDSNIKQITDESIHGHHRVRRGSAMLDQIRAARKTGNREELYLRSSIPYKKLLMIHDPTDIVPIHLTLDPPYNMMEKPKFYAVANYRNSSGSYESAVVILRYNKTADDFTIHATLPEYAPTELESFSGKINPVMHKNFLSVAGFQENVDRSGRIPQVAIYEITAPPLFKFKKIQEFKQYSVRAMKYIEISQITYIILGMYYHVTRNDRRYSSPSQLLMMRFDFGTNLFHFHSSLPGSGVTDLECFTFRGNTYLTVANYRDNIGRLSILSFVYIYNEQFRGFEMMQYLSTNGARDIEHFTLANEKYLVVANEATGTEANKKFDVYSDVYKLVNGKFALIQKLETYGAIKWKSIAVPNCKQDVLLVYSDQRGNIDEVGIFSFSHDKEKFRISEFSVYQQDAVNSTFRPRAKALSTYSVQDVNTGEYKLFLWIGASDTSQGSTIYQLSYEVILTDSPLDAFTRGVEYTLGYLQAKLLAVKNLLAKAKTTLEDAVTKTGKEIISGTKTIFANMIAEHAIINILNITDGSMLLMKGNKTYRTDPSIAPNVSLSDMENQIMKYNTSISNILREKSFIYTNIDQNISASLNFNEVIVDNITVDNNVVVLSNYINDVNISELNDIAHKNEDTVITGLKTFSGGITVNNSVIVDGKVNNLNFSTDLVINGVNQNITSLKIFRKSLNVTKNLNTGRVNGIDLAEDALLGTHPGYVTGVKKFNSSVTCKTVNVETINSLNMKDVIGDRVTRYTKQNITGSKTFIGVFSLDNLVINDSINGIGVRDLERRMKMQINDSIIHGNKIFTSNITVLESLVVDDSINGLSFPANILLKSSKQIIIANKVFTGEVKFGNVTLAGKIDGMNLTDFVTLDTSQQINGFKTFKSVSVDGDIILPANKTVNGIDLSTFAKGLILTTNREAIDQLTIVDNVVISNSSIKNLVNKESISSLDMVFNGCLHLDGDQNITSDVEIISNISVSKDINAQYINNFSFPTDFASLTANQTFNTDKIFQDDATSTDVVVNGSVNNVDINKFNDDIVTDGDGTIFGEKTIIGNVFVNGSLATGGLINGLNFTEDLLFYTTDQFITANKFFEILNFTNQEVTINGNVGVETTIDGVDLSKDWDLSTMTETSNETVTGEECFQNTDYNRSVDYINGVDLSALREDIVSLNTAQIITSEKLFERMVADKNINTTIVDGVDVSEMNKQIVFSNKNSTINGHVTFNNSVSITGDLTTGLIDNTDMNTIRDDFISLSENEILSNLTVNGDLSTTTLNVTIVNNIVVNEDIIYRSKDQIVSGLKRFQNVTIGNLTVNGKINGVNLTALKEDVVLKDQNQTIIGQKIFKNDVEMGSVESSGLVNDIDLRNWNIARNAGNLSFIKGVKTFSGKSTVDDLCVVNDVNGKNITALFANAVMFNEDEAVEEVIFENGLIIDGDLKINGSAEVGGLINGVNLTALEEDVLKTEGEQEMTSKYIDGSVTVSNIKVTGYVNGLNISEDLVTKDTIQTIRGIKHFNSIKLVDDVSVGKLINGINVNMSEITAGTLFKNVNNTQIITGRKTFVNVQMDSILTDGLMDGLNVTKTAFVTLNSTQVIHGHKRFTEDFVSNYISVRGNIADVNLKDLNRTRVLLSANQTIKSNVVFADDVSVDENVIITQLVNKLDLSSFNKTSPTINNTELDNIKDKLDKTLSNQCDSLRYVKKSLTVSAYRFDYFTERQSVSSTNIHHAEFFIINGDTFLAYSVSNNRLSHCTNSIITRWNAESGNFTEYQLIQTSGAMKMVFFHTAWDDSYLLVINSKSGCTSIEGPSQLYKWNSTVSKFQLSTQLPTKNAVDAAVYQQNNSVIIFVCNAKNTLSTWSLTPLNITPSTSLDHNPVSVFTFLINEKPHVAVASRSEITSSSGYVNIYDLQDMTRVQSIASRGASSISSFTYDDINYLIIANDHGYSSDGHSTYHLSVDIYSYSSATNSFEWFRSIPAYRAYRVSTYQIGSFIYLAIVHFDKSVAFYQFGLELGFQKIDELFLPGARDLAYTDLFNEGHVFVSSSRNVPSGTSKLFAINPSGPDPEKVKMTVDCQG